MCNLRMFDVQVEEVTLVVEVVEGVTVMAHLQQHPAPDIQVPLAVEAVVEATLVEEEVVEATLVVEVVEASLVVEVEEETAMALLLHHRALLTLLLLLAPARVLTQPLHRAQAPAMDLPLEEGVVAYPAMEEEVVEVEVEEDMEEVEGSLALRCLRRVVSKFPNKWQFRWGLTQDFAFTDRFELHASVHASFQF